jgi:DNA polymerase-3 subunit epsilon
MQHYYNCHCCNLCAYSKIAKTIQMQSSLLLAKAAASAAVALLSTGNLSGTMMISKLTCCSSLLRAPQRHHHHSLSLSLSSVTRSQSRTGIGTRPAFFSTLSSSTSDDNANTKNNCQTTQGQSTTTALIFDTETTSVVNFRNSSTDKNQPDLVQLGFILVDRTDTDTDTDDNTGTDTSASANNSNSNNSNWIIRNKGSFLVQLNPGVEISEGAQNVHGISKQDCIQFGIESDLVLDIFENVCRKADFIVAHNIKFDKIVLETAFHRNRYGNGNGNNNSKSFSELLSSKKQICTMMESMDLCKLPSKFNNKTKSYKWPSLLEAYNFVTNETNKELEDGGHDAMIDAEACLKVFQYLVDHGHVTIPTKTTKATAAIASSRTFLHTVPSSNSTTSTTTTDSNTIIGGDIVVEKKEESTCDDELFLDGSTSSASDDNYVEEEELLRSIAIEEEMISPSTQPPPPDWFSTITDYQLKEETNNNKTSQHHHQQQQQQQQQQRPPSTSNNNNDNNNNNNNSNSNKGFRVRGNTFPHKETIKQLGGKWDGQSKEWVFFDNNYNNTYTKALSELESYTDLKIVPFNNSSSNNE